MFRTALVASVAAALIIPAVAGAHVTLQPNTAAAGGFTRLDVRVPNERDDAATVKVVVQLPPGVATASYEPVPGWTVKVTREQLEQPIDVHGEPVTEQVSRITWTGNHRRGGIVAPGQFQDFGVSLRVPDGEAGATLTFKALQTYEDGEVVRWIGPEDAEKPAPTVTLVSGEAHGAAPAATPDEAAGEPEPASAPAAPDDSDGLAIAALIVGGLGLAAGAGGLVAVRRARTA
jgi:periplasmic copper chaperone A